MIKKEKRMRQAREEEVIVERTCDLCGEKAPYPNNDDSRFFDIQDVKVSCRYGSSEPEFGTEMDLGTEIEFDLCPSCFKNKLVPWMESQGANPRVTIW